MKCPLLIYAEKAEERKREQDILYERKLTREREVEDHLFGDKERFVTSAYRKKLEETAKWQEEEKKKCVLFQKWRYIY